MFKGFIYLMLVTSATGALLALLASTTMFLALGLLMLMVGTGGLSAAWMNHACSNLRGRGAV
jgi:hypothetical protein